MRHGGNISILRLIGSANLRVAEEVMSGMRSSGSKVKESPRSGLLRKKWEKPALQRLEAREASHAGNMGNDGVGGGGENNPELHGGS